MDLAGKRILMVGPVFHHYHSEIAKVIEKYGASVDFHKEREYGWAFKIRNNLSQNLLANYQKQHYNKIVQNVKGNQYDYLFVIRGYMMPQEFLTTITKMNPGITKIMYQWDAQRTCAFKHLIPYFDKVLSFDYKDCDEIEGVEFLPLFYTRDVAELRLKSNETKFDFFFMGWFLPERYEAMLKFRQYIKKNSYSIKFYLYLPPTTKLRMWLKGKSLDETMVFSTPLSRNDYLEYLSSSQFMVDVSNVNQTGLAMRVIESIGAGKGVLTSNKMINRSENKKYNIVGNYFDIDNLANLDLVKLIKPSVAKEKSLDIETWVKAIFNM